jgi:uncharacterized protein YfaP (DUF2135 family)
MPISKYDAIYKWKRSGLICDDYNALYETYIKTTECEHCKTEFTEKNKRCLDHDHTTGLFRKIVCNRCNAMDSYIKYPNGYSKQEYNQEYYQANKEQRQEQIKEYQRANKQKISERKKEKIECECGSIVRRSDIAKHKRSKKNSDYKLNNLL